MRPRSVSGKGQVLVHAVAVCVFGASAFVMEYVLAGRSALDADAYLVLLASVLGWLGWVAAVAIHRLPWRFAVTATLIPGLACVGAWLGEESLRTSYNEYCVESEGLRSELLDIGRIDGQFPPKIRDDQLGGRWLQEPMMVYTPGEQLDSFELSCTDGAVSFLGTELIPMRAHK